MHHLANKEYSDWAITACFYAAIHYVEARFFLQHARWKEKHSETSMPTDRLGDRHSKHAWRLKRIVKLKQAHKVLVKLRDKSEIARYMVHHDSGEFTPIPAHEIFESQDVCGLLRDLELLKTAMKVEMIHFVFELDIYNGHDDRGTGDTTQKIVESILVFSSVGDFLHNGRKILQARLTDTQMKRLGICMQSKDYSFTR